MRKSFETYIQESSTLKHKSSKNQGGGNFYRFKYIISGFILGLFFVGTFSYAANPDRGTIGKLFNFIAKGQKLENGRAIPNAGVYRLDGAKIEDKTITNYELANNAITSEKIKDGEVKTADIGNLQVKKDKLAKWAVDNTKLAPNSVKSSNIVNGEVKTADIGDGEVTNDKLHSNSIDSSKIVNKSVTGGGKNGDIAKNTITEYNISDEFKARSSFYSDFSTNSQNSQNSTYFNGKSLEGYRLSGNGTKVPTSEVVKNYVDSKLSKVEIGDFEFSGNQKVAYINFGKKFIKTPKVTASIKSVKYYDGCRQDGFEFHVFISNISTNGFSVTVPNQGTCGGKFSVSAISWIAVEN